MIELDAIALLLILVMLIQDILNFYYDIRILSKTQEKIICIIIIATILISMLLYIDMTNYIINSLLTIVWGINLYKREIPY